MQFDVDALRSRMTGKKIGFPFYCLPEVDSTNRAAAKLAREGAPEGTMVLADRQIAGRGRLRRTWQSPPGCNLHLSVIFRPALAPPVLAQMTLLAGVAVAEAVAAVCPDGVAIKWPNDVLIRERKVCGILSESVTDGGGPSLIVGIGLNVNIRREDFDPGHRDSATSLREETGRDHSREGVVVLICERLEGWYETFRKKGFTPIRDGWLARSAMSGRTVRVLFRNEVRKGRMEGIDLDGALLLADGRGEIHRIVAGDATILKG